MDLAKRTAREIMEVQRFVMMSATDDEARFDPINKANRFTFVRLHEEPFMLIDSAISAVNSSRFM